MILLYTDFGWHGPYVGQMKAVIAALAPKVAVVDLMHDAPVFAPRPAAYLLAALADTAPAGAVFLCVVDPGVGDPARRPVVVQADGRWFVGPDNGLFNVVAKRAQQLAWWDISWRPERLSASFHGRDLFAPVAARLACGEPPPGAQVEAAPRIDTSWPDELARFIYIDAYGNAMSGLRARHVPPAGCLRVGQHSLTYQRTFSAVPLGQAFWYENSLGLVEVAVNQGHAARELGIAVGMPLAFAGDDNINPSG